MSGKSLIFASTAMIALAAAPVAPALAASTAGNAASTAVNKVEHAVGANEAFTKQELKSAVALNKLDMPEQKLSNAKIEDRTGASVGEVHDVVLSKTGKPTALHVDVGGFLGIGERMVAIPASRFSWLPDKNILVANMTKKQIESLKQVKTGKTSG
jgi:sporulation protein YlmC with PRC-barrel domain